jgi:IS30 family transposase
MKTYNRIGYKERVQISTYLSEGFFLSEIARKLNRSKATVSREISRCNSRYDPEGAELIAQEKAGDRRKKKTKLTKNSALLSEVLKGLRKRWSPEQISEDLKMNYPTDKRMQVSHESIYTYLYVLPRGELRHELLNLLRQKKKSRTIRKRRAQLKEKGLRAGKIPGMFSIEERPKEVENRSIPGHWEGDVLLGKGHKSVIGTLVERKTRAVILVPLKNKTAPHVRVAFQKAMKDLPKQMAQTLTYDQGHEMAEHKLFTKNTKIRVYFCHPASPWERGTCENTNGLLRDYFPKGTDLSKITKKELKRVQHELNERPRKTLGYLTPKEVFAKEVLQVVPLKT